MYKRQVIPITVDSLTLTEVDVALSKAQGVKEKLKREKESSLLSLTRPTKVKLTLFSSSGRALFKKEKIMGPGTYPLTWEGLGLPRGKFPRGVYFLQVKIAKKSKIIKISNFP